MDMGELGGHLEENVAEVQSQGAVKEFLRCWLMSVALKHSITAWVAINVVS